MRVFVHNLNGGRLFAEGEGVGRSSVVAENRN